MRHPATHPLAGHGSGRDDDGIWWPVGQLPVFPQTVVKLSQSLGVPVLPTGFN